MYFLYSFFIQLTRLTERVFYLQFVKCFWKLVKKISKAEGT